MNSNIRRRGIVAAITAFVTVAALAGCASGGSTTPASGTANANPYNLVTPGTLTVATVASKPFAYLDSSSSNWIGFEPDLVTYAAKLAGIKKVVFIDQEFSSLLADVAARKYDIGAVCIGYTPERAKTVDFTSGYYKGYLHFIAKPSAGISSIADLAGKRVGTSTGSVEDTYLKTKTKATFVGFPDFNAAVQALVSGQIDAVFLDDGVAQDYVKQYPQLTDALKVPGDGYCAWPLSKEDTALKAALNKGIAKAISSGFLEKNYKKWLPSSAIFPEYLPNK
jgi:polar amino acid transport system substrate-binding protein